MNFFSADTFKKVDHAIPGLGELTGLEFEPTGTRQFLGIQYATFPRRFAPSKILTEWKGKVDATSYAPRGLQRWGDAFFPFLPRPWLPGDGLEIKETETDELLSLNISVPKTATTDMPVLFWIHGGANVYCGVNTCEFDGVELATLSSKIGKPTIVVTIGFRIGCPGYLFSSDIKKYNVKKGYSDLANFGFWDQVNALRWVRRYISAFGGDPENITIFGQSAGSACVQLHVLRAESLFKRAIMQSGVFEVCGLANEAEADKLYFRILDKLGIDTQNLTSDERVEELIKVDSVALKDALESCHADRMFAVLPNVGDKYLLNDYGNLPLTKVIPPPFLESIMMGDTNEEFPVGSVNWTNMTPDHFWSYLSTQASHKLFQILVHHYGVSKDLDQEQVYAIASTLATDCTFCIKNYILANNPESATPTYCYHFDQKSVFKVQTGQAHHSLDFAYVWNIFNEAFEDPNSVKLSIDMGTKFIQYANGEEPWERHTVDNPLYQVFGPDGDSRIVNESDDLPRLPRYAAWKEIIANDLHLEFFDVAWPLAISRNATYSPKSSGAFN